MKKLFRIAAVLCLIMAMAMLAGCGGSDTSGDQSGEAAAEAAEEKAADPQEKFLGSWNMAAAEQDGIYMAGNFGEMLGMSDLGMLNISADGSGDITLGDEEADKVAFTWTMKADDVITLKAEKETDYTGEEIELTYGDEALAMTMEQDGKTATAFFTHDGSYAGAKVIDMEKTDKITSKDELTGKWTMSGMQMMGITVYGDQEAMANMGSGETYVTFNDDGSVEMAATSGTWKIDDSGATLSASDITGSYTVPVKKMGDEIVLDYSNVEAYKGLGWIAVFSRAE